MTRVVALAGSLSDVSRTRMALTVALQGAADHGAGTELVDLRDFDLPLCGQPDTPDVERLRAAVQDADGVLLGTPEYHGGYSGVLKNALDLMGFDEFQGKMVGLVGVSGGALGGTGPLSGLRDVCRSLHAWVVPKQATVPHAHRQFDEDGQPVDDGMARRLREVGAQVARFSALHQSPEAQSFLAAWETAYENPGA